MIVTNAILYHVYSPEKMKAIVEKEQAARKKKPKSKYQKLMEEAREEQRTRQGLPVTKKKSEDLEDNHSEDEMTASQRIALARKRMAEKYGDDYDN